MTQRSRSAQKHEAVIFDLFGTLIDTVAPSPYDAMLFEVADALGAPRVEFQERWREAGALGTVDAILRATAVGTGRKAQRRGGRGG